MKTLNNRSDLHLSRKAWHIGTGLCALYAFYFLDIPLDYLAKFGISFAVLAFSFEFLRLKSTFLNSFFLKMGSKLLREDETDKISGLPYYAMGAGLSLLLFPKHIALISIFFLVFADPFSSLIGVLFGRNKILPNKSLEGCLSCWFICYLICHLYLKSYGIVGLDAFIFSFIAGFMGAISELISFTKINDNLSIPLLSGFSMYCLNFFFQLL